MHLLYLDESGDPNNREDTHFVLGGVSVPEQNVRWLSHQLEQLAREIDTENHRDVEFHASEMFSTRGRWGKFERPQRIENIKRVLKTLDRAHEGVTVFACAVHRESYPKDDPVIVAFENLTDRFDKFLKRMGDDQRGLIVFDKSSYENSFQSLSSQFRQRGNRWGSYMTSICEVPLFIDSKASRIIQLADHIAYSVFRRFNANDLTYYNCIEGRFDRNETTVFGLVHLQSYNRSCTCPACVTKKR